MKRISLIAIPFLLHAAAFCQFRPLDFDPASDGIEFSGIPTSWVSHACVNTQQKRVLITFVSNDQVLYYLVDTTLKILDQRSIARNTLFADYYGQKYEVILQTTFDSSLKNYIRKKDGKKIVVDKIDLTTKTSMTYDFLKLSRLSSFHTSSVIL